MRKTPLFAAASGGNSDMFHTLRNAGSDMHHQNARGLFCASIPFSNWFSETLPDSFDFAIIEPGLNDDLVLLNRK